MTPSNNHEQQIQQSWEANAEAWSDAVQQGQIESRRVATDAAILQAVIRYPVRRVLDLGCGEGWLTRDLSMHGIEAVGVDGSSALIDRARQGKGGQFNVLTYAQIAADSTVLGKPYDAITCNFSLLGEDIGGLLRSLRQVITPGGHLLIQTVHPFTASHNLPYVDGWRIETFDSFGGAFREPMPWYFRTISSWFDQVIASGWAVQTLAEPLHPQTQQPLSLLLTCGIAHGATRFN